jgi:hypothetical protein
MNDFARKSPDIFRKAMERGGIQFLNWANNGSANTSKKPPIRWGVLRGSSSAFMGQKLIATFKDVQVKEGTPTPADSYAGEDMVLTWGWNTDYAAKMHEWNGGWGPFTKQDGNAGRKWLEEHLDADRNDLWKMITKEYKGMAGT